MGTSLKCKAKPIPLLHFLSWVSRFLNLACCLPAVTCLWVVFSAPKYVLLFRVNFFPQRSFWSDVSHPAPICSVRPAPSCETQWQAISSQKCFLPTPCAVAQISVHLPTHCSCTLLLFGFLNRTVHVVFLSVSLPSMSFLGLLVISTSFIVHRNSPIETGTCLVSDKCFLDYWMNP